MFKLKTGLHTWLFCAWDSRVVLMEFVPDSVDRFAWTQIVDTSFPAGQSNLNLYPSGDCKHGTERT